MADRPQSARLHGAAVALSVVLLTGCQAQTDASGRTVLATPTPGQMFGVTPAPGMQPGGARALPVASGQAFTPGGAGIVEDHRVVAGRTVQIVRVGSAHHIVVDGRVLASDSEDNRVVIQGVHQGGGRIYVLIEEQSGGNACPSQFQAIDLSNSTAVISPQFGNCSDLPSISVAGGALRVAVPGFRAARATAYTFRDGRLSR